MTDELVRWGVLLLCIGGMLLVAVVAAAFITWGRK
jgi:hypothetical protein